MCDAPVLIRNPNYGKKVKAGTAMALKDCSSQFIPVPCGHCNSCIANKQMQLVQRIQMESLTHHLFFITLTYAPEVLPRVTTSSGYDIPYADISDVQNMFKRIRKNNLISRPFKYVLVSERGSEKGRPHFHMILMLEKLSDDTYLTCLSLERDLYDLILSQWKRKISGSNQHDSKFVPLCHLVTKFRGNRISSNYDCHYVNQSLDNTDCSSVAFYVLKYMLKPSTKEVRLQQALKLNLPSDEYDDIYKLVKSKYICSKDFGDSKNPEVVSYLRDCVKKSKSVPDSKFPMFFSPSTGQSFPLSRYYKSKGHIYGLSDALHWYFNSDQKTIDTIKPADENPRQTLQKQCENFAKLARHSSLISIPTEIDYL